MAPIIDEGMVVKPARNLYYEVGRSGDGVMTESWPGRFSSVLLPLLLMVSLTGCDGFFVPPNSGGGGGGTGTGRVYVTNATTSSLAGFTIGTGTLTAVPNSPLALGYTPVDAVVTPDNAFVYVVGPGAIYVYKINSDGSVTGSSNGAGVAIVNVTSIAISPDGNWLFGLDTLQTVVDEFSINRSNGNLALKAQPAYSATNAVPIPKMVRVSPLGNLVFIAIGPAGDVVFTFDTSTGALASSQSLTFGSGNSSDNSLAIDKAGQYLYIGRTGDNGGIAVYTIGSAGSLNSVPGSPFTSGNQPNALVIDSTGKYLYAANRGDNNISGYAIGTNSALTALNSSPYASGSLVNSIGVDSSGKYLLAGAAGGGADLTMYSFDSVIGGKLNLATSTATGTGSTGVTAVALTH
jgi:6-phosphogluconolactonase (cycloisomerase 2 family)